MRSLLVASLLLVQSLSFVIPAEIEVIHDTSLRSPQAPRVTRQRYFSTGTGEDEDDPLPVVIWHGLGDSATNDGINSVASLVEEVHPGTYVHIISLTNGSGDASQSWFGNVNEQIDLVCNQLYNDPIISTAPAIDAIGFSQGGQFLRGYVERCGHWAPPVRNLITFGGQHNGIAAFQKCSGFADFLCNAANALLSTSFVWSDYIQHKIVPAQYYRPTSDLESYLEHSNFIADINNEREVKNATYADNLAQLEHFVMIVFDEDKTVIPKESGWFAEVDLENNTITPLVERKIYTEDWIGLKKLNGKNALVLESVKGGHMQLNDKDLRRYFKQYLGPVQPVVVPSVDWKVEL